MPTGSRDEQKERLSTTDAAPPDAGGSRQTAATPTDAKQPAAGGDPDEQAAAPPSTQSPWRHQAGFLTGLIAFFLLGIANEIRGFDLWRNYAFSGVVLGTTMLLILRRFDVRIPLYIQWVMVIGMASHYIGGSLGSPDPYRMGLLGMHGINGTYHHFDGWDHLTHTLGIGAAAMGFAYLFEIYQTRRGLQWSPSSLWIVTMLASLAAGVGVELYEFLGKTAFQTIDQGGYENTMRDLHFNFIGAAIGAGVAVSVNRTRFRQSIQAQWGTRAPVPAAAPWWQHVTPPIVGIITFSGIPAVTALYLMTRFFAMEIPPDDRLLYDPALETMTIMTAVAAVAAPVAARWFRRYQTARWAMWRP